MTRKKLPIGIQTFREIREEVYYYVDKSAMAVQLAGQGKNYFLSRPRHFGKSLFLNTLKELFEGNEPLFKGLAAETLWNWTIKYPVLRISFRGGVLGTVDALNQSLLQQLTALGECFSFNPRYSDTRSRFQHLIQRVVSGPAHGH